MKTSEALKIVGGLSKPSKMPGWAYGLPAAECKTGSKLASSGLCLQRLLCIKGLLRVSSGSGCTVQETGGHPVTAVGWCDGVTY